ncbi:phage major capsid family protein [Elizabethkingia anophelis]|uniref:phage major capsid family protein n=1 Tax=Elizabethkingia anophelis TaxID=1117645 RepID=UPI0015906152|nr:phage major capsid protein [Elizabethkingia anophelis]
MADKKTHEDKVRKDELDNAIKEALKPLNTEQTQLSKDINDVAEKADQIKEEMRTFGKNELKDFLRETIKEKHQDFIDAFKSNKDLNIVISKAPAMHMTNNGTVTNVDGLNYPVSDNFSISGDIAYIRIPENFILGLIRNRQKEKVPATNIKMEQVATEGAVAVTAEGAVKPLLQYKFKRTSTSRKKYAGRIEWTEEFEMDFEELLASIVKMFERDVLTDWQDGLIEIMEANATAYLGSVLDGTLVNPDNGLAVIAAITQIRALNYIPDYAVMNPQDVTAAVYTQDNNGNFALKPYIDAAGNRIEGVKLVQSNKMPVGQFIVGDFNIYDEVHSGFIMRKGYYGEQFIENENTLVGEVFSILNAAPLDYKAVIKGNLATIKAALKKPAA